MIKKKEFKMEKVISVREVFPGQTFIGMRASGEIIRKKMDEIIKSGSKVVIDFTGIEMITQGFGDEVIGIYVRFFGKDYFIKNVKVINYNDDIKNIMNWVVNYSIKMAEESKK